MLSQPTSIIIASIITVSGNVYIAWYNKRKSTNATIIRGNAGTTTFILKLLSRIATFLIITIPFGGLLLTALSDGPVTPVILVVSVTSGSLLICSFILLVSIFITSKMLSHNVAIQLGSLKINNAKYGTENKNIDVTDTVCYFIQNGCIEMKVINSILCKDGDPFPGIPKQLFVDYTFNDKQNSIRIKEGDTLLLP